MKNGDDSMGVKIVQWYSNGKMVQLIVQWCSNGTVVQSIPKGAVPSRSFEPVGLVSVVSMH